MVPGEASPLSPLLSPLSLPAGDSKAEVVPAGPWPAAAHHQEGPSSVASGPCGSQGSSSQSWLRVNVGLGQDLLVDVRLGSDLLVDVGLRGDLLVDVGDDLGGGRGRGDKSEKDLKYPDWEWVGGGRGENLPGTAWWPGGSGRAGAGLELTATNTNYLYLSNLITDRDNGQRDGWLGKIEIFSVSQLNWQIVWRNNIYIIFIPHRIVSTRDFYCRHWANDPLIQLRR